MKPHDERHNFRNRSGQALVEFAVASTALIVLLFGLIDFGRAIYTRQILVNLTREAANLSSRGTSLSNTFVAVSTSAQPLKINQMGYVILSVLNRKADNSVVVADQFSNGGSITASRVAPGGINSTVASSALPTTSQPLPPMTNGTLYVAEIFYGYTPVTPIGRFLRVALPTKLYDVAYFTR